MSITVDKKLFSMALEPYTTHSYSALGSAVLSGVCTGTGAYYLNCRVIANNYHRNRVS